MIPKSPKIPGGHERTREDGLLHRHSGECRLKTGAKEDGLLHRQSGGCRVAAWAKRGRVPVRDTPGMPDT